MSNRQTVDLQGSVYCAEPFPDRASYHEYVMSLATECNNRIKEAEQTANRHASINTRRAKDTIDVMSTEAAEARAERDTWSLLAALTHADLLKDIDLEEGAASLEYEMQCTDPSASLR